MRKIYAILLAIFMLSFLVGCDEEDFIEAACAKPDGFAMKMYCWSKGYDKGHYEELGKEADKNLKCGERKERIDGICTCKDQYPVERNGQCFTEQEDQINQEQVQQS